MSSVRAATSLQHVACKQLCFTPGRSCLVPYNIAAAVYCDYASKIKKAQKLPSKLFQHQPLHLHCSTIIPCYQALHNDSVPSCKNKNTHSNTCYYTCQYRTYVAIIWHNRQKLAKHARKCHCTGLWQKRANHLGCMQHGLHKGLFSYSVDHEICNQQPHKTLGTPFCS